MTKEETRGQPIPKEPSSRKIIFTNGVAAIEPGYRAPLDDRSTLEMMADRDAGAST